ncbi:MAG: hypothetical protein HWE12_15490 [Oceanospirillaceae bacterium]|nr:hypothetical protein [Oceanospirillaceae bacterium]
MRFQQKHALEVSAVSLAILESIAYSFPELSSVLLVFMTILLVSPMLISRRLFINSTMMAALLMIGEWTYVLDDQEIYTLYGIRVFNFSFLTGLLMLCFMVVSNKPVKISFIIGILYVLALTIVNIFNFEFQNFLLVIRDLKIYIVLALIIFLSRYMDCFLIVNATVRGASIYLLAALVLGNKFDYGGGNYYLAQSASVYLLPALLIVSSIRWKLELAAYWALYIFILIKGDLFIGGKTIILLALYFLYMLVISNNYVRGVLVVFALFLMSLVPYLNDPIVTYKLSQVVSLFSFDSLLHTKTSVGNIYGELYTFMASWSDMGKFLFGGGLGGGVVDTFGVLAPWVGVGGYDFVQYDVGLYTRMHLTFTNILVKFGLFGLLIFLVYLSRYRQIVNRAQFYIVSLPIFLLVGDTNPSTFIATVLLLIASTRSCRESVRPSFTPRAF